MECHRNSREEVKWSVTETPNANLLAAARGGEVPRRGGGVVVLGSISLCRHTPSPLHGTPPRLWREGVVIPLSHSSPDSLADPRLCP